MNSKDIIALEELKKYQDYDKKGRVLPLGIGEHVFYVNKGVHELEITGYDEGVCNPLTFTGVGEGLKEKLGDEFTEDIVTFERDAIGVYIFRTQEEAEAANEEGSSE